MPAVVLPPFYYHDHFIEMLDFVGSVCADCLTGEARDFIGQLQALSLPERCLYIRFANRKGTIFNTHRLAYAEIADLPAALAGLHAQGLIRPVAEQDIAGFLQSLTKDELAALCREAELQDMRGGWAKPRILEIAVRHFDLERLQDAWPLGHYIVRDCTDKLDYLLFLYFGRGRSDLKAFALRDLGIVAANNRDRFQSRFDHRDEAAFCFACSRAGLALEQGRLEAAFAILGALPAAPGDYAASCSGRVAHRLGLAYERLKDPERAMAAYRLAECAECRERLIRLLYAAGARGDARLLLERVIDDPSSDEEHAFATDFFRRKFQQERIGALTGMLRQGETVQIDDAYRDSPEEGVIAFFRRVGWQGYFTENRFWRELFGLVFWDELFCTEAAAGNGFDQLPVALIKGTFWAQHRCVLERKLRQVGAGKALAIALRTIAASHGTGNGLFAWECLEIEPVTAFLRLATAEAQEAMLTAMAKNFMAFRDGFPDLMLVREGALKFIEVKAEGDAVRRNQLTRLQQLQSAGLAAEICRVQYCCDPRQDYVVVDVETTGQSAAYGRITEIGAVKIRGGEVVGEWHSLVNPGRVIPAFITQLTGITNAMVAAAPAFGEIADSLAAFLEGSIFVAHNVNFDYGFIKAEFGRCDYSFRMPKLCTCAGMRRQFPGLASYSLGNLCAVYDITLENHHRALDDARAAGRLLCKIIGRRMDLQATADVYARAV